MDEHAIMELWAQYGILGLVIFFLGGYYLKREKDNKKNEDKREEQHRAERAEWQETIKEQFKKIDKLNEDNNKLVKEMTAENIKALKETAKDHDVILKEITKEHAESLRGNAEAIKETSEQVLEIANANNAVAREHINILASVKSLLENLKK